MPANTERFWFVHGNNIEMVHYSLEICLQRAAKTYASQVYPITTTSPSGWNYIWSKTAPWTITSVQSRWFLRENSRTTFTSVTLESFLGSVLAFIRTKLTPLWRISQECLRAVMTRSFNFVSCLPSTKQVLTTIWAEHLAENISRSTTRIDPLYLKSVTTLLTTSQKQIVRQSAVWWVRLFLEVHLLLLPFSDHLEPPPKGGLGYM